MSRRDITPVAGGVRGLDGLEGKTVRLVPPPPRGVAVAPAPDGPSEVPARRREQLSHDIRHELGTVMMLASLLADSLDAGSEGRLRANQLLVEARWLTALQDAVDDAATPALEPLRVDLCARQTVAVLGLSCATAIDLTATAVWAVADKLALWRALRNIVGNAIRAAGSGGRVAVCVEQVGDWAVAQVDDNGPGFGAARSGIASMGLDIVYQSVASCGGQLEIRRGDLGGCCVRLRLPATSVPRRSDSSVTSMSDSSRGFDALADL